MIVAAPGAQFEALLTDAPPGGEWWVTITDGQGNTIDARSNTGIVEEAPGVFTATRTAPPTLGTFTLVWDSGAGGLWIAEQLVVTETPQAVGFRPTVEDVAAVLIEHTRNPYTGGGESAGEIQGTFTSATTPTRDQVEGLIDAGCREVAGRAGVALRDELHQLARQTVVWHAAASVAAVNAPAATPDQQGEYQQLVRNYRYSLDELVAQARVPTWVELS